MKFRPSLQLPREPGEAGKDGQEPGPPGHPFKMRSLRYQRSKTWNTGEETGERKLATRLPAQEEEMVESTPPGRRGSRKLAVQDFFRRTSSRLRTSAGNNNNNNNNNNNATSTHGTENKFPRLPVRGKSRRVKQPVSRHASKRNSHMHSFDISDDVIARLSQPGKTETQGKIQSNSFFVQQRIRASSREASSSSALVTPLLRTAHSQAELDRKPLSRREVDEMFIGAPYFRVQEVGGGRCRPQVVFRGEDVAASQRFGTDYASLEHASFQASSLGLHRTRQRTDEATEDLLARANRNALSSDLLELPSMLSATGLDPGTIGFEHFLHLPLADTALLSPDPSSLDRKRFPLKADPEQLGLREWNPELLIYRLDELSGLHAAQHSLQQQRRWTEASIAEMGEELFGKVLDAELGTTFVGTGDVSLKAQIAALQRVLAEEGLWFDFGVVEERIRVGMVMWGGGGEEVGAGGAAARVSGRDVLLLQVLLAAELLVRLQAVRGSPGSLSEEEIKVVGDRQTRKLEWDLVLARTFLENLAIRARTPLESSRADKRTSRFSVFTFLTAKESPDDGEVEVVEPVILPRNEELQLEGLMRFAEAIEWPHRGEVRDQVQARLSGHESTTRSSSPLAVQGMNQRPVSGFSMYATPLSSPRLPLESAPTVRKSWLGGITSQLQTRPGLSRMTTANSIQLLAASPPTTDDSDAGFDVGGWLSRSWLAGLVLPGEPASHFLISTLLENSSEALEALGDSANLYGGFVYRGRGYWSLSCVVGRVLAATRGAGECMGWVSVPLLGSRGGELGDGWVEVDVKDLPLPCSGTRVQRIKDEGVVARDSDPLHGVAVEALQAGDFSTPVDGPLVMGNEVCCHGLSFSAGSSGLPEDEEAAEAQGASMTFSSPLNTRLGELVVPLTYDVQFVASYPCHPESPKSPTITSSHKTFSPLAAAAEKSKNATRQRGNTLKTNATEGGNLPPSNLRPEPARASATTLSLVDIERELPPLPAHPLHFEHHYTIIPVATLLSAGPQPKRPRALSSPEERGTSPWDGEITILDCRGGWELELLGRAWCAKKGENALVGRSGRTCLGCCVREARGLGIGVVLRI
ncbi:hypothetical protein LTR62_001747 [Meristemomyces frigidus]|uniref:Uncharacterized protein n=1 Tax=Meristemomyces frigidus TaxID=1508187 RepID=A0AAN7YI13_9PEZI|nr:hypothetical protein LTR62_001747 [Meristemomyces frigidus]